VERAWVELARLVDLTIRGLERLRDCLAFSQALRDQCPFEIRNACWYLQKLASEQLIRRNNEYVFVWDCFAC